LLAKEQHRRDAGLWQKPSDNTAAGKLEHHITGLEA
jgi:hypothetical protein